MDNHHGQAREGKIMKILCVVGARPNLMKIAPILRVLAEEGLPAKLVHTGQHYDIDLNDTLFARLGICDDGPEYRGGRTLFEYSRTSVLSTDVGLASGGLSPCDAGWTADREFADFGEVDR